MSRGLQEFQLPYLDQIGLNQLLGTVENFPAQQHRLSMSQADKEFLVAPSLSFSLCLPIETFHYLPKVETSEGRLYNRFFPYPERVPLLK